MQKNVQPKDQIKKAKQAITDFASAQENGKFEHAKTFAEQFSFKINVNLELISSAGARM
jgi:hypothetical protein